MLGKYEIGQCAECPEGELKYIVNKSKKLCEYHNKKRKNLAGSTVEKKIPKPYIIGKSTNSLMLKKMGLNQSGANLAKLKKESGYTTGSTHNQFAAKDREFFTAVWKVRKHVCEECGKPLGDKLYHIFMSHKLVKKRYTKIRWYINNLFMHCAICHTRWDHADRVNMKCYNEDELAALRLLDTTLNEPIWTDLPKNEPVKK